MNECRFDLKPLECANCGAYIGELGTCEDSAVCDNCLSGYKTGKAEDLIISPKYQETKSGEIERAVTNSVYHVKRKKRTSRRAARH
jgi:hypothetical protein